VIQFTSGALARGGVRSIPSSETVLASGTRASARQRVGDLDERRGAFGEQRRVTCSVGSCSVRVSTATRGAGGEARASRLLALRAIGLEVLPGEPALTALIA